MYGRTHSAEHAQGCGHAHQFGGGRHGRFFNRQMGGFYRRPKYNVPLNIVNKEQAFEVHVYAYGFAKENIKISVIDDALYISGTRELNENELPDFSHQEFPVKTFERALKLNGQVDITAITAKQEDGVLKITLPKTPEAQKPAQEIVVS